MISEQQLTVISLAGGPPCKCERIARDVHPALAVVSNTSRNQRADGRAGAVATKATLVFNARTIEPRLHLKSSRVSRPANWER